MTKFDKMHETFRVMNNLAQTDYKPGSTEETKKRMSLNFQKSILDFEISFHEWVQACKEVQSKFDPSWNENL